MHYGEINLQDNDNKKTPLDFTHRYGSPIQREIYDLIRSKGGRPGDQFDKYGQLIPSRKNWW